MSSGSSRYAFQRARRPRASSTSPTPAGFIGVFRGGRSLRVFSSKRWWVSRCAERRNALSSSATGDVSGREEMKGANNRTPPFASFRTYVRRGGVRAPQHDPQSVEGIVREAYCDAGHSLVGALAVDVLDAVAPLHECHNRLETRRGRRRCGAPRALSGAPSAARGVRFVVLVFRCGFPRWPERLPGVPCMSHAPRLRHGAEATAGAFSRTPNIDRPQCRVSTSRGGTRHESRLRCNNLGLDSRTVVRLFLR